MKYYVDNTLSKLKQRNAHLDDLSLKLDDMEQFQLKLNPNNYTFGVTSRKFLGYIIFTKGINVDPKKL